MEKVILITGASGGMGKALTNWFRSKDYRLVLHYHQHPIEIADSSCDTIQADLSQPHEVERLCQDLLEKYGKIDVLINNAGISKSGMSWKYALTDWEHTMAINLTAPFLLSKFLLPTMKANHFGRIINLSSVVAQTGVIGTSAYAASKAGLLGLTKTLAKEVAGTGVTVNALALGYFGVGMIKDVPEQIQEQIIAQVPMQQLGNPDTVCKTIEYLISDETGFVTGQTLNLNGGLFSN